MKLILAEPELDSKIPVYFPCPVQCCILRNNVTIIIPALSDGPDFSRLCSLVKNSLVWLQQHRYNNGQISTILTWNFLPPSLSGILFFLLPLFLGFLALLLII